MFCSQTLPNSSICFQGATASCASPRLCHSLRQPPQSVHARAWACHPQGHCQPCIWAAALQASSEQLALLRTKQHGCVRFTMEGIEPPLSLARRACSTVPCPSIQARHRPMGPIHLFTVLRGCFSALAHSPSSSRATGPSRTCEARPNHAHLGLTLRLGAAPPPVVARPRMERGARRHKGPCIGSCALPRHCYSPTATARRRGGRAPLGWTLCQRLPMPSGEGRLGDSAALFALRRARVQHAGWRRASAWRWQRGGRHARSVGAGWTRPCDAHPVAPWAQQPAPSLSLCTSSGHLAPLLAALKLGGAELGCPACAAARAAWGRQLRCSAGAAPEEISHLEPLASHWEVAVTLKVWVNVSRGAGTARRHW